MRADDYDVARTRSRPYICSVAEARARLCGGRRRATLRKPPSPAHNVLVLLAGLGCALPDSLRPAASVSKPLAAAPLVDRRLTSCVCLIRARPRHLRYRHLSGTACVQLRAVPSRPLPIPLPSRPPRSPTRRPLQPHRPAPPHPEQRCRPAHCTCSTERWPLHGLRVPPSRSTLAAARCARRQRRGPSLRQSKRERQLHCP